VSTGLEEDRDCGWGEIVLSEDAAMGGSVQPERITGKSEGLA